MVGSVICFSIMDICVKWLDYYPVGQVLFLRFFIGFIPIFFIIQRTNYLIFIKHPDQDFMRFVQLQVQQLSLHYLLG